MNCKNITNRITRISEELREESPDYSVVIQNPSESEEEVQKRADGLKKENIRQFGRSGLIVIVTNYAGVEVKNDTKQ